MKQWSVGDKCWYSTCAGVIETIGGGQGGIVGVRLLRGGQNLIECSSDSPNRRSEFLPEELAAIPIKWNRK